MDTTKLIIGNKRILQFITDRIEVWEHEHYDYVASIAGYNNDWNKLLPAVEKINKSENKSTYNFDELHRGLKQVNIELVWEETVKFIEWYRINGA
jgi:hypothetical protein